MRRIIPSFVHKRKMSTRMLTTIIVRFYIVCGIVKAEIKEIILSEKLLCCLVPSGFNFVEEHGINYLLSL